MKILTFLLLTSSLFAHNIDGCIQHDPWAIPALLGPAYVEISRNGQVVQVSRVNPFGYYHFRNVPDGQYDLRPFSKLPIVFLPQTQSLSVKSDMNADFLFESYNLCFLRPC